MNLRQHQLYQRVYTSSSWDSRHTAQCNDRVLHRQSATVGSPLLQSHGWLSVIIKVFGHFPQRSRRGSWWHSCIPKHRGGNYNEASIHFSDHKVCSWHQLKSCQAVVEKVYLCLSLLQCRQCTFIYLWKYRSFNIWGGGFSRELLAKQRNHGDYPITCLICWLISLKGIMQYDRFIL